MSSLAFLILAGVSATGNPVIMPEPVTIPAVIGRAREHIVRHGESLYSIARKNGLGAQEVQRANGLRSPSVRPGTTLILPTWHIPPMTPDDGIVLNVPERAIYVFRDGKLLKRFPGAVGKAQSQTALGHFTLKSRVVNPTWRPPRSMVINEGVRDAPVPPGPGNPLGDRWMGWSKSGFGFHSTTSPRSIGRAASHGCVRLYPEGARSMYKMVSVGMPIHAIYRPLVIGKSEGAYYLSVFPDIYRRGGVLLSDARLMISEYGLSGLVDEARLRAVLARQQGTPQRIVGEEEAIVVDGSPVSSSVRPVLVKGSWLVPLDPVASALGITVEQPSPRVVRLQFQGRTFEASIGETTALVDGENKTLPVPITELDGKTLMPLRVILDLANISASVERGIAIRIGSQTHAPSR